MSEPSSFYDKPILNSPYHVPTLHHRLDEQGQPMDAPPLPGRRRASYLTPVPKSRKERRGGADQALPGLADDPDAQGQRYDPLSQINGIREDVARWRALPNPRDWGVTPVTAKLLRHWRDHAFSTYRPFFCQIEAAETAIWLAEVARKNRRYRHYRDHLEGANAEANPDLFRIAMKMATGAGKTTVMAMLIAWQTLNKVRAPGSKLFSRGFLIVAPGITIRDRLRVLETRGQDSYYRSRELVPDDMLRDLGEARIVITNFHAFQRREIDESNRISRALRQGRGGEEIDTRESEGQMVRRVAKDLMGLGPVTVINDEAHHCYRRKQGGTDEEAVLTGDERKEARKNADDARIWISGLEAVRRVLGIGAVYDLSATPFFLSGSGYREGTLFPWTVSDFSLMDAIESGLVKLPRIPVADNIATEDMPVYRDLWAHIGKSMPKKGRAKGDPSGGEFPDALQKLSTALESLYSHYKLEYEAWRQAGIPVPPVFIVVCNNTASSKMVHDWIAGYEETDEHGDATMKRNGHLELFRNYDENGNRLDRPRTLLIDSAQIESGTALNDGFREAASAEIEQFKRERAERQGGAADDVSDGDLLREVMNTVGEVGRLGEQVRCVVSVSMLTEGWDANTVTHILGVRAFGTQLLCEQVVGRGLRRWNYGLNEEGLFEPEYSNILGIPFNFTDKPRPSEPKAPPNRTLVRAVRERADLEIRFPRITGYRTELPAERLRAEFGEDSVFVLTPDITGPTETLLEGIVGQGVTLRAKEAMDKRPSTLAMELAKYMLNHHFLDADGNPRMMMMSQIITIAKRWLDEGNLVCKGGTAPWMLQSPGIASQASQRIMHAIVRGMVGEGERAGRVRALPNPYNPEGSTAQVSFVTTKPTYATDPARSHIDHVALDSGWEGEFARVVEGHPRVLAYAKNQGMGFTIPYLDGTVPREYVPDFLLRLDAGEGEEVTLIVEIKGYRGEGVKLKSETMRTQWIPGVNNLSTHGRWAFAELRDLYEFRPELDAAIDAALEKEK